MADPQSISIFKDILIPLIAAVVGAVIGGYATYLVGWKVAKSARQDQLRDQMIDAYIEMDREILACSRHVESWYYCVDPKLVNFKDLENKFQESSRNVTYNHMLLCFHFGERISDFNKALKAYMGISINFMMNQKRRDSKNMEGDKYIAAKNDLFNALEPTFLDVICKY